MTVFAGCNGAGKTTLSRALRDAGLPTLDPDSPLAPSFGDAAFATSLHSLEGRDAAVAAGASFAIETTLTTNASLQQLHYAKANDYDILLVYVGLDSPELAIERVSMRVMHGGTLVNARDIRRSYGRSLRNLPAALAIVDSVVVFDNSQAAPSLVALREFGTWQEECQPLPRWFAETMEAAPSPLGTARLAD